MTSHYDLGLATISVVIAILASYAGLLFAGHVTSVSGRPRLGWLVGGAVVMGLGIWSMHFVGMLAFRLPVPIGYGLNLILVSVAVAIAASLLALIVVSGAELRPLRLFSASILMGAAISGMHYIGMAAMSAPVRVTYSPVVVALSILIAIVASFVGLWLAFRFRSDRSAGATLRKAASAVVMGVAISGMHYTGMAAARFAPGSMMTASGSHVLATTELGEVIALGTLVIIMLGVVGSAVERTWLAERAALTEDALRASEERWRNLFENAPVGVVLTDSDGRYVSVNPTFQRMVGYADAELRRFSPPDITHEDDRPATRAILEAHAAGQSRTPRFEKRYRRKDGSVIWAEVSAFPVPVVGSTPLLAGIVVDITDRKRAEDELRRSEASLADAQRISHTGSWRWKVDTGEISWSAEVGRIHKFDPATPLPSAAVFMEMVHAADRPAFQEALDRALRERSRFHHEYRIVLLDGSVKHLYIVGRPDLAGSGELEYVGVVMDITERRRAEEALRGAQAELARAGRLTMMGELAASIAHEINQPLTAIVASGSAGLHWLNRETPDLDQARDALSRIVRDGARAGEVIRGLRALARKSGPQLTRLDIDDTINEVLALTHSEVRRHGVALHTDLAAGARPVMGDRVQLQQVLLNLILNGLDAMRAITDRPKELAVSSGLTEPGSVLVSVEDSGTGLDPAIAPRIFEPFVTTKADGLGMGLSICRSIIEAHGGRLWVSPREPHGTTLRFTVPTDNGRDAARAGPRHRE
jgi:PAS domain S-box-containing protein